MSYRSGDVCPKCHAGRLKCRTSRPVGDDYQEQRLECDASKCGHKETAIVPANAVWRRQRVTAQ